MPYNRNGTRIILLAALWLALSLVSSLRADTPIYGVGFSPYLDGQVPPDEISPAQIETRLDLLTPYTQWIRTWGSASGLEAIPALAKNRSLKVAMGVYLNGDPNNDNLQKNNLLTAAAAGSVDIAIVGSESLIGYMLTEAELIAQLQDVRRLLDDAGLTEIPVAAGEPYGDWANSEPGGLFHQENGKLVHAAILQNIDLLFVHLYPFHEGVPIEAAAQKLADMYSQVVAAVHAVHPGLEVVIGETGWPSAGNTNNLAVPSLENEQLYYQQSKDWSRLNGIPLFYFEFCDENWKTPGYANVENHWGLFYSDGTPKFALSASALEISPAALDFSNVLVGRCKTAGLLLTNTSDSAVSIHSLAITGGSGIFYADSQTYPLAAGARKELKVTFQPAAAEEYAAQLTFSENTLSHTVPLTGRGASLEITGLPVWGKKGKVSGLTGGILNSDARLQCYINVYGWYSKPTFDKSLLKIAGDGSWSCNISKAPHDREADQVAVNLVSKWHNPDIGTGQSALPDNFWDYPYVVLDKPHLTISSLTIVPGPQAGGDTVVFRGDFAVCQEDLLDANSLQIGIRHEEEVLYDASVPFAPDSLLKGKFVSEGDFLLSLSRKSWVRDNTHVGTFLLQIPAAGLAGLRPPVTLEWSVGDFQAQAAADGYSNAGVFGSRRQLPLTCLSGFLDALSTDQVRLLSGGTALVLKGRLALRQPAALELHPLTLRWANQEFTAPAGAFTPNPKKLSSYACKKAALSPSGTLTGTVDLEKGTFALTLKGVSLAWQQGPGFLGLAFADYNESVFLLLPD